VPRAGQVRKLTDIETLGVALVTRGANKKKWAVTKGDEGTDMTITQLIAQVIQKGDMPMDEGALDKMCASAGLDKQAAETFKAVVKLSSAYKDSPAMLKMLKDELPKMLGGGEQSPGQTEQGQDGDAGNSAGATENDSAAQGDGEKENEMSTQKSDTTSATQKPVAEANDGKSDVVKAAEAQVAELKELLTKQQSDFQSVIKGMQDQLSVERDERLKNDWIAKAEKELQFVPGKTAAELGSMLFDIEKKVSREMAETQFGVLKASSVSLEKSEIFRPSGTPGKGTDGKQDAVTQLLAKADVVLEKSDILKGEGTSEMHKAQAVAKALELHPQLYAAYLNENPAQRGNRVYSTH
jgi:hypothetical protein